MLILKIKKNMSNYNFHQPLNEPNQPPKQASDFLNEFRDWWIKVPLMSKFLLFLMNSFILTTFLDSYFIFHY